MTDRNIYQRINDVMKAVKYVQKDKQVSAPGQNYKAVTHDQLLSAARQALVDNGVVIYPSQTKGKFLIMRDVNAKPEPVKMGLYEGKYEINFVNIDKPEERITLKVQAQAMDNGDKAPGKALTYATKAAILKVLSLETGENEESREEERELKKTISQDEYDALSAYCVTQGQDGPQWTKTAEALMKAYKINNINELPKLKFKEALNRAKKHADNS